MSLRSIDPSSDRSAIRNHSRGGLVRASEEEGLGFPGKRPFSNRAGLFRPLTLAEILCRKISIRLIDPMTEARRTYLYSLVHSEGAELRGRLTPGPGKVSECGRSGEVAAVGLLQLVA